MKRVDLILMDLRLPHEDGCEALLQVRANKGLRDTLVVAVTAPSSTAEMQKARAAGFDGFLSKPLDSVRLWQPESCHLLSNTLKEDTSVCKSRSPMTTSILWLKILG